MRTSNLQRLAESYPHCMRLIVKHTSSHSRAALAISSSWLRKFMAEQDLYDGEPLGPPVWARLARGLKAQGIHQEALDKFLDHIQLRTKITATSQV